MSEAEHRSTALSCCTRSASLLPHALCCSTAPRSAPHSPSPACNERRRPREGPAPLAARGCEWCAEGVRGAEPATASEPLLGWRLMHPGRSPCIKRRRSVGCARAGETPRNEQRARRRREGLEAPAQLVHSCAHRDITLRPDPCDSRRTAHAPCILVIPASRICCCPEVSTCLPPSPPPGSAPSVSCKVERKRFRKAVLSDEVRLSARSVTELEPAPRRYSQLRA
jgi:hypothetical protein